MRTILYLLTASLLVSGVASAAKTDAAGSDQWGETPYCEDGQRERVSSNPVVAGLRNAGVATVCEGEHWEGHDAASGDASCSDSVSPNSVSLFYCGGDARSSPKSDELGEVGARVSQSNGKAFVGADIGGVGTPRVYTEGTTTAVYLEDYSNRIGFVSCLATAGQQDCNALAGVVHKAGITQGSGVSEEGTDQTTGQPGQAAGTDCSIDEYEAGFCSRDNTAVTVSV